MESLDEAFRDERVKSVFVYTREAHPGELRGHHESFEQKCGMAREMAGHFDIRRQMLVDDMEGSAHRAYGLLPNMTYIVARGGKINYRASWTDARTIRFALETLSLARAGAKEGRRVLPYFMEWNPTRVNDGRAFFNGLLHIGGERAALEYIEAAASRYGEGHVKAHRRYWAEYLEDKG
jgi:hypothetical protein